MVRQNSEAVEVHAKRHILGRKLFLGSVMLAVAQDLFLVAGLRDLFLVAEMRESCVYFARCEVRWRCWRRTPSASTR